MFKAIRKEDFNVIQQHTKCQRNSFCGTGHCTGYFKGRRSFVPQEFPKYDENTFKALLKTDYKGRAKKVFSDFLSDFTEEEISDCVEKAYTAQKFGGENPAPISYCNLDGTTLNILELWHGPTCAFKDMALQILPHLLTKSLKKKYDGKTAVILVATSGDTGKAALEGFKDVEHTKIVVFYPVDGVSPMQKHQMNTQEGENVRVCAIKGNFDDAQTGVKKIFTTPSVAEKLAENNMLFSSANSINWGRLLPQIVYYISAYCDLVNDGKIELGDKINVVVPTGNFGNILASYYASLMGLQSTSSFVRQTLIMFLQILSKQAFMIRTETSIQQFHLQWISSFQVTLKDFSTSFQVIMTKLQEAG